MRFYFETNQYENFLQCGDLNPSGIRRFTVSPVVSTLARYTITKKHFNNFDVSAITYHVGEKPTAPYIVPVGVAHSPNDWCGADQFGNGFDLRTPDRLNVFSHIPQWLLEDMQNGLAFLMLDQTHEGYHADWLFDWFHNSCAQYNIKPEQIIYITGNVSVEDQYFDYCLSKNITNRICVLGYLVFEAQVSTNRQNRVGIHGRKPLPTFMHQLAYKKNNLPNIKVYNALQKRPRAHRGWLFHGLVTNNLLDSGINSMNHIDQVNTYYANRFMEDADYEQISKFMPIMPPIKDNRDNLKLEQFSDGDSGKFVEMFNEQITLDSWVSVVSEASFAEDTCFISEKTFKPIACRHPFMVYGNKHTLKYLREMGYLTFHPFIDETYDNLDTWERHDAIIAEIKKLMQMTPEQLLVWYENLGPILKHNSSVLRINSEENLPQGILKLNQYIQERSTNNVL